MKKIVLFFLMMLPVAVSGQQKEKDIPEKSISGVLNQMKDMPHDEGHATCLSDACFENDY